MTLLSKISISSYDMVNKCIFLLADSFLQGKWCRFRVEVGKVTHSVGTCYVSTVS
jgi:hypothetical protein